MAWPNTVGPIISSRRGGPSPAAPDGVSTRPAACCRSARCRRLFSAMMTAPSTMRPKSSAPRLMRLALMLPCSMPMAVISIATGITSAVMSAARKLPSSSEQHERSRAARPQRDWRDRLDRGVDQFGAVEHRSDFDARRQRAARSASSRASTAATPCGCCRRSASGRCRRPPHGRSRWRCRSAFRRRSPRWRHRGCGRERRRGC